MLYYVPLEGYKERYTQQWSAPITGWLERRWIEAGIPYIRVDAQLPQREIKTGCVLDAVGRSVWCFEQIKQLLYLAEEGKITNDDVIYFDDFWTPGIEALPYAFELMGIKPQMFAFLHAQSVDEFDFTHPMRHWMRPFEQGIAAALTGIFVCCHTLQDLVAFGHIADRSKIHVTGHPFCSDEVRERMTFSDQPRENNVVWSSRFDAEKNPDFFLRVALLVLQQKPDTKFVICTGSKKIRSNDPAMLSCLERAMDASPSGIILREDLTKEQYYAELTKAKIQFNSASQDFVAITLLEASVAGCYPIYPYFRSFPETFEYDIQYMYDPLDVMDAATKICKVLDESDLWTDQAIRERQWIHERFDTSWVRMLVHMGLWRQPWPLMDPFGFRKNSL